MLNWVPEVMDVSFVRGHPRRAGWVVAHLRRPNRPAPGQLPLLLVVASPPADGGGATKGSPARAVRSAKKSAITRS